ncbi:MAG: right-handed parallel beta-helix repeat-containing protein [Bdellovibrionota bacterium]
MSVMTLGSSACTSFSEISAFLSGQDLISDGSNVPAANPEEMPDETTDNDGMGDPGNTGGNTGNTGGNSGGSSQTQVSGLVLPEIATCGFAPYLTTGMTSPRITSFGSSPSSSQPVITGVKEANSMVRIYSDQNCTSELGASAMNSSTSFSVNVSVGSPSRTRFYVKAQLGNGDFSTCNAFEKIYVRTSNIEYIDSTYSGSSNGSINQPWKSLGDITWSAGDVFLIKRGSQFSSGLTIGGSGTNGNEVVIGSYGSGEKPRINLGSSGNGITCSSRSNIVIQDLDIRGGANGVNFTACQNITFDGLNIQDTSANGIAAEAGNYLMVYDSTIKNANQNNIRIKGGDKSGQSALDHVVLKRITSSGAGVDNITFHNRTSDLANLGACFLVTDSISFGAGENGIDATTGHNLAAINNVTYDNGQGGFVGGHELQDYVVMFHKSFNDALGGSGALTMKTGTGRVAYSSFVSSGGSNLILYVTPNLSDNLPVVGIKLYNNLFYRTGGGDLARLANNVSDVEMKNNVFVGNVLRMDSFNGTYNLDYNAYGSSTSTFNINGSNKSLSQGQSQNGVDMHGIAQNLDLVKLSDTAYVPSATSPLVQAGTNLGLTMDLSGKKVDPTSPHIGAYSPQGS